MPYQPDIDPSERRFLAGVLALRDVPDVERCVAGRFRALDLPDPELRVEVLGAISDAYRIDRALAPERPLLPLLDTLLASRVTRMRSRLDRRLTRVA
jgi:hypothetical protein